MTFVTHVVISSPAIAALQNAISRRLAGEIRPNGNDGMTD
jgi:hypothetical protein